MEVESEARAWPLALYDVIAILVPGLLLPAAVGLVSKRCLEFYNQSLWVVLLWGYVLGHLVQAAARLMCSRLDRIWKYRGFLDSVTPDLKELILCSIRAFYGEKLSDAAIDSHTKDLCYSPVWNRMDNYKVFVSLADLSRALAFLFLLAATFLLGGVLAAWPCTLERPIGGLGLLGAAGCFSALTARSRFFRRLADGVVYHSFLSFMAETNCGCRPPSTNA